MAGVQRALGSLGAGALPVSVMTPRVCAWACPGPRRRAPGLRGLWQPWHLSSQGPDARDRATGAAAS